jgi:hypothetical protein
MWALRRACHLPAATGTPSPAVPSTLIALRVSGLRCPRTGRSRPQSEVQELADKHREAQRELVGTQEALQRELAGHADTLHQLEIARFLLQVGGVRCWQPLCALPLHSYVYGE